MDSTNVFAFFTLGSLIALIPICGLMALLVPFLMPKSECFTVTVPDSAITNPVLRGYKRHYAIIVAIATAVCTAAAVLSLDSAHPGPFLAITIVATLLLSLGSYGLMLHFRAKVRAYKEQQGWKAPADIAVAAVGAEPAPAPLSMKWDLLYLPLLILTAIMGLLGYNSMPDMIPMHIDLSGQVTDWAPKNLGVALMPALLVAFMAVALIFKHWTIVRSKKPTDPSLPAASSWAYGMFAHVQSILTIGVGLILCLIGPVMVLTFTGAISITTTIALILVLALVTVVATFGVSVAYGQNGSRLIARVQEKGAMPQDNDQYWKAGIFYYNPADPSLFLPERFGIGWTFNWARPAVWAIVGGFFIVLAGFVAAMAIIAG